MHFIQFISIRLHAKRRRKKIDFLDMNENALSRWRGIWSKRKKTLGIINNNTDNKNGHFHLLPHTFRTGSSTMELHLRRIDCMKTMKIRRIETMNLGGTRKKGKQNYTCWTEMNQDFCSNWTKTLALGLQCAVRLLIEMLVKRFVTGMCIIHGEIFKLWSGLCCVWYVAFVCDFPFRLQKAQPLTMSVADQFTCHMLTSS